MDILLNHDSNKPIFHLGIEVIVEFRLHVKVVLTDRVPIHRGRVLRVGPGKRREDGSRLPVNVKPGQIVQYHSCDVDSGTHVLIEEADILFIEGYAAT